MEVLSAPPAPPYDCTGHIRPSHPTGRHVQAFYFFADLDAVLSFLDECTGFLYFGAYVLESVQFKKSSLEMGEPNILLAPLDLSIALVAAPFFALAAIAFFMSAGEGLCAISRSFADDVLEELERG